MTKWALNKGSSAEAEMSWLNDDDRGIGSASQAGNRASKTLRCNPVKVVPEALLSDFVCPSPMPGRMGGFAIRACTL